MKWSSQCVVRTSSLLILIAAISLVVVGLITNSDGNTSFSLVFLAFTILMIMVIFWNFFSNNSPTKKTSDSSPGVIDKPTLGSSDDCVDLTETDAIPNPLDSGIDIPLM